MEAPEPPSKKVKLELGEEVEPKLELTPQREPTLPVATPEAAAASAAASSTRERGSASSPAPAKRARKGKYDTDSEEEEQKEKKHQQEDQPAPQQRARIDLARLLEHLEAADETLKQIQGRNVLLIVGRTGVGKSSLVQRISGRRLHRSTYSDCSSGKAEPKQVFEVDPNCEPLQGFDIGHESKSKTKNINHLLLKSSSNDVVYVDSAGFSDSSGIEVDIATSLSIKRVAETCGALRFVVLVSCASFLEARGAAVRSLVELVKEFVEDFRAHRPSFTFLFTHTDHLLMSSSCSIEDLRRQLEGTIGEVGKHTNDKETKAILSWWKKCLQNQWWHLVDVFHPLDSDLEALRTGLERFQPEVDEDGEVQAYPAIGLRSGESCREVVHYSLTQESVSKLVLQLRSLTNGVRDGLKGDDFESLAENMGMLDFLHEQMKDIGEIREAARKIAFKVAGRVKQLLNRVYETIHCTSVSTTDTSKALVDMGRIDALAKLPFEGILKGESGIPDCKSAVKVLRHFEEHLDRLCEELEASGLNLASQPAPGTSCTLQPLPPDLRARMEVLAAWSQALRESVHDLPGARQTAARGLRLLGAYSDHLFSVLRQEMSSDAADFQEAFEQRATALARLVELGAWLPTLPVSSVVSIDIKTECLQVEAYLQEHVDMLVEAVLQALKGSSQTFQSLLERGIELWETWTFQEQLVDVDLSLRQLLKIGQVIQREKEALQSLSDSFQRGLARVEAQVAQCASALDQEARTALKTSPELGPFLDSLPSSICMLGALIQALGGQDPDQRRLCAQDDCQDMLARHIAAVDKVVFSWVVRLNTLWKEGQQRIRFTSAEIAELATLLKSVNRSVWRDLFTSYPSPPAIGSIKGLATELTSEYNSYVVERSTQALGLAEQLLADPFQPDVKSKLARALLDRDQLQALGLPTIGEDSSKLRSKMSQLLSTWEQGQLKFDFASTDLASVLTVDSSFAWEVELVLIVCEALAGSDLLEQLEPMRQEALRRLGWLHAEVISLMSRPIADFELKRSLLDAMVAWNIGQLPDQETPPDLPHRSLQHVSRSLIRFDDLLVELRTAVSQKCQRIRDDLVSFGRLEEADEELQKLDAAVCLDIYLRDFVRTELNLVKQQVEMSRLDFDQTMKSKIESCDFEGMKRQFAELVAAQSEVAQQRAKELWQQLSLRVESEAAQATSNISDGASVASSLRKLEVAASELEPFLAKFPTISIREMVSSLVQEVNDSFGKRVRAYQTAVQASNLLALAVSQASLVGYLRATKDWLAAPEEALEAVAGSNCCLAPLDRLLTDFARSLTAEEASQRADTSRLAAFLSDLKALISDPGWQAEAAPDKLVQPGLTLSAVSVAYSSAVQQLSQLLNTLHTECPVASGDPAVLARARCVYKYVVGECSKGLGDHIDIDFCPKAELEMAESEHLRRYSELSAACWTVETARQAWSSILKPWEGLSGKALGYYQSQAYSSDCEQLGKQLRGTVEIAAQALRSRAYRCCGKQCSIAIAMEQMLAPHPAASADLETGLEQLRAEVQTQLNGILEKLSAILEADDAIQFEQQLFALYKFVKYLKAPFPELLEALPPFHACLAKHISSKVDGLYKLIIWLELPKIKKSVEGLRRFGHVMSGVYALYADCVQSDDKEMEDEALGKLKNLCSAHLSGQSLHDLGRFYAVLELPPHATEEDIHRAFALRNQSANESSSREGWPDDGEEQQLLNEAKHALISPEAREGYQLALSELFSEKLRDIPNRLLNTVRKLLYNDEFDYARDKLVTAKRLDLISALVTPPLDTEDAVRQVQAAIRAHLEGLSQWVSTNWARRNLRQLNDDLLRLEEADSVFCVHKDVWSAEWGRTIQKAVKEEIDTEGEALHRLVYNMSGSGQDGFQMLRLAEGLLRLGHIMGELAQFQAHASTAIEHVLEQCQDEKGPTFVFGLGMLLEQGKAAKKDEEGKPCSEDKRIARVILESFRHFKDVLTVIWNQQTSATQKDADALLQQVEGQSVDEEGLVSSINLDSSRLKAGYASYMEKYDELLLSWKAGELDCPQLAFDLKAQAKGCAPLTVHDWTPELRRLLPELLAGLAAYYTISKSGESFERLTKLGPARLASLGPAGSDSDANSSSLDTSLVLLRLHPAQVFALLRMFGYDNEDLSLARQLVQISTGEGKSLILGLSSLLLALFGFQVRCVCYSSFLSWRDHKLFAKLFADFGVNNLVMYSSISTFKSDKLAEQGDIRELTRDMLHGNLKPTRWQSCCSEASDYREEILLVDEVDVFFGLDFYGRTYNPVVTMQSKEVQSIYKMIWQHRQLSHDKLLKKVLGSRQVRSLARTVPGAPFLIEQEVNTMILAVHGSGWKSSTYHVDFSGNRIGFKAHDCVEYHTLDASMPFRYLYEAELGNFQDPELALWNGLALVIGCGSVCYSNFRADCILGVSGTLSALGPDEWKIMRTYNINHFTIMPSVYGPSNFRWWQQSDVEPVSSVETRDDHFQKITELAKQMAEKKRAVIVIFENPRLLDKYKESAYIGQVEHKNVLSEGLTVGAKEFAIRKAATSRQVTFTTKAFGRGMDFMSHCERLAKAGGVHIIHTFFSLDKSEEVQIQGRTARQGKKGSYSMLLCDEDLQSRFGLTRPLAGQMPPRELYDFLDSERTRYKNERYSQIEVTLAQAEQQEAVTMAFFNALLCGDAEESGRLFEEYHNLRKA